MRYASRADAGRPLYWRIHTMGRIGERGATGCQPRCSDSQAYTREPRFALMTIHPYSRRKREFIDLSRASCDIILFDSAPPVQ